MTCVLTAKLSGATRFNAERLLERDVSPLYEVQASGL